MDTARTGATAQKWSWRGLDGEPSLQELLDDPIMHAVMARDGVCRAELVRLIAEAKIRLERRDARRVEAPPVEVACG